MLDPRRLRLLTELADRGTIAAVAEALHFTSSTVSHGLSALERDVGVPLLERTPRSVRLTPAGEALAREGRAILARLTAAEVDARAVGRLDRGEVVLATFQSAGACLIAEAVGLMRSRHPGLSLRLLDTEPPEALERLTGGEVDVAVVYELPHLPTVDEPGIQITHLVDDPLYVCLPPGHPRHDSDRVRVRDLREEAFVAGPDTSACHVFTRELCRREGFEPDIAFETKNMAFLCALVNAGTGVSVMPRMQIATAPERVATREIDPPVPPRRIVAASRKSASELSSVRAVLDVLTEVAARWRDNGAGLWQAPPPA
jgi:DNA-binding transcriptional LysR family regulator